MTMRGVHVVHSCRGWDLRFFHQNIGDPLMVTRRGRGVGKGPHDIEQPYEVLGRRGSVGGDHIGTLPHDIEQP